MGRSNSTKHTQKTPRKTRPADRAKTTSNQKRSRSRGIQRPTVTKLEEDPKNLRAVVSRQLLDDVQRLQLDRSRHPRNTPTTISKCVLYVFLYSIETSRVTVRLCPRFFPFLNLPPCRCISFGPATPLLYPHAQIGIP